MCRDHVGDAMERRSKYTQVEILARMKNTLVMLS